jgi:diguanylate cyclase (GGDEF)-like protein
MRKQLLVVDDSPEIHPLVAALLADEMVDVHSAQDPSYGLTLAASLCPDLVLLDVDMPGMDGYEFCRRLKANQILWAVPVIFLTAKGNTDQKVRGLELGAVDYIAKPFSPGELLARVRSALRTQAVINGLEDRALVDALTGLGNARMFNARLNGEVSVRARSPKPMSCAFIDINGFAAINRDYGEPFGDQMLQRVADVLRDVYRPEDVTCRLRADDFAVLMPDTPIEAAIDMARDVRSKLSRANFTYRGASIPLTCGIGVAAAREAYDRTLLERAAQALEQTPDRRSDQLIVSGDAPPTAAAERRVA